MLKASLLRILVLLSTQPLPLCSPPQFQLPAGITAQQGSKLFAVTPGIPPNHLSFSPSPEQPTESSLIHIKIVLQSLGGACRHIGINLWEFWFFLEYLFVLFLVIIAIVIVHNDI